MNHYQPETTFRIVENLIYSLKYDADFHKWGKTDGMVNEVEIWLNFRGLSSDAQAEIKQTICDALNAKYKPEDKNDQRSES